MSNELSNILQDELKWLAEIIKYRYNHTLKTPLKPFQTEGQRLNQPLPHQHIPNDLSKSQSEYAKFIIEQDICFEERLLLVIALAAHLVPSFYKQNESFIKFFDHEKNENAYGGGLVSETENGGLVPTGLTFLILAAGNDFEQRLQVAKFLSSESKLIKMKVLKMGRAADSDTIFSGRLIFSHAYCEIFLGLRANILIQESNV